MLNARTALQLHNPSQISNDATAPLLYDLICQGDAMRFPAFLLGYSLCALSTCIKGLIMAVFPPLYDPSYYVNGI